RVDDRARPTTGLVADDLDVAVRDDVQRPVVRPDGGGAEREPLDPAGHRAGRGQELDGVPDPELILEEDEEARQRVLNDALRAEPQRTAADPGPGEERP